MVRRQQVSLRRRTPCRRRPGVDDLGPVGKARGDKAPPTPRPLYA
ncbi:MAG: hypothetical protein AVDCRST_MAG19-4418 [uncultured Thermomicrobiales bacterium]|uniref:Uncharacterized protein n=1 Tax=uncultured Thermomicrobiales bacterium TaxID=1645740 RepID=A0A6J4VN95_9BACT|nr:MAG: hypothetical protein AVDCRST_MAG19-4418 [uncultured Thermomicrobiales bacterium]